MSKDKPASQGQLDQKVGESLGGVTKVSYGGGRFGMEYDED